MTNEPVGPGTDLPDFDADTAVTPLGEDRYGVTLLDRWNIVDGPNGGYLAAIMTRAMSETVAEPDRKSTRLNSSHSQQSRMPSSA